MAQTVQRVQDDQTADGVNLTQLGADRLLAVESPAGYWIWPVKHVVAEYQVYKGRKYLRKGEVILEDAIRRNAQFREGPGPRLKKLNEKYARDLQIMYENSTLTAAALRRWKQGVRKNMVNIVLSSEAIGASEDRYMPIGSIDDSGMPSAMIDVSTFPQYSPRMAPRREILEVRRPATIPSLGEMALQLQQVDPFMDSQKTAWMEMAQLDAATQVAQKTPAAPPGVADEDADCTHGLLSPSGPVAVAE
ncbi:hypothetical protein L226DRAFT_558514 [Lentinus tigrinus ALCF2SS1-7]|uniref:uncharacterized protein n=1 Tax=Lentinus tigrinus ALCF2SS1-7 TaxID=1328758 RepID=UPI0011661F82|nr:hypothetical protein L226DRAFT_558514 [Lentinus tigrinus ALCF2SS1-7]